MKKNLKKLFAIAVCVFAVNSVLSQEGQTFIFDASTSTEQVSFEKIEYWADGVLPQSGANVIVNSAPKGVYLTGMGGTRAQNYLYSSFTVNNTFNGTLGGEFGGGWGGTNPRVNAEFKVTGNFTTNTSNNINITPTSDSNPLKFDIVVGGTLDINSAGTLNFGGGNTTNSHPYADSISIKNIDMESSTRFNAYTGKLAISNSLILGSDAQLKVVGVKMTTDTPLLSIDGDITLGTNSKIVLDFARTDFSSLEAGEYTLISLAATESVNAYSSYISIWNLGAGLSTVWDKNTIKLTVIPEPSTIGITLGTLALIFISFRRRK